MECGPSLRRESFDGNGPFDLAAILAAAPAWNVPAEAVRILTPYAEAGLAEALESTNGRS